MITGGTYIPVDQVIGDAAIEVNDDEFRKAGKPFYLSAAQRGLSILMKDVPADVRHFEAPIPDDLIIKLPWGMTNKSLAKLYDGPGCDLSSAETLFIKPNMFHKGGAGYVANNMGITADIVPGLLNWNVANWWPQNWIYFAGEANGYLYLSSSCRQFGFLHITYSGLGIECWGSDFCIPEWAREAITDYVVQRAASKLFMLTKDATFRDKQKEKDSALSLMNPSGTWSRAMSYWGRMDQKQRNDVWTSTTWYGYPPY
jgi:hypothetical protein